MMPWQRSPERVQVVRSGAARALLVMCVLVVACGTGDGSATGDAERGARLFSNLPCSGCHGTMAQGQFGPTLAGTDLTFEEVRSQVRSPRDQMPPFSTERVSEQELRDIYAWLNTLAPPTPTPAATRPPEEATLQALNTFYAEMTAADLIARMDALDESALRVSGTVISVSEEGRYTQVQVHIGEEGKGVDVIGLFDTHMKEESFPAAPGDRVTVYGVGAKPVEMEKADGSVQQLPQMQILYVRAN